MIKGTAIRILPGGVLSHSDLLSFWREATVKHHDIEYIFEDAPDNLTKVTPIYKNRGVDIVGESTYEPRTGEGSRSEYAFYADQFAKYRRPAVMWPSGRPLVANKFNHDHSFRYHNDPVIAYSIYNYPSEESEVSNEFLIRYWVDAQEALRDPVEDEDEDEDDYEYDDEDIKED